VYLFAIIWITIKRILHGWKVVGALLGGLVLAAGVMAAIPIYSAGSLQSSFFKEWMARDTFRPPFTLIVKHTNDRRALDEKPADLARLERFLEREVPRAAGQAARARADFKSIGSCVLLPRESPLDLSFSAPRGELANISGLETLAEIAQGRWYEPRSDGVVEIVVDEATLEQNELLVGQRFNAWYELQPDEQVGGTEETTRAIAIPVEVVGFFRARPGFTMKDWIYPPPFFDRGFVHPDVFRDHLVGALGLRLEANDMEWVFAPEPVKVAGLDGIVARLESMEKQAAKIVPNTRLWLSPIDFFREFSARGSRVTLFLASLSVPVMGMIVYYIVLMAGVAVQHRRKEILVMHGRGAGRLQAVTSFFLEWLILGAVAAAVGPFLGAFIARAMGASSGFLSFVNREGIPASVSATAFRYALGASALAVAAGMGPVFATFRHTIVTLNRRGGRRKIWLWHRLFLDVIFLALALVAYRELNWQSIRLAPEETIAADPLLFFVPVIFLLGAGLLLLRIYPSLLAGLRWIAGRLPGVVWQLALRRLTRSAIQYFPLLLLLILTLSLGIYSAATARTLSKNFEDRIRYEVGADLAVTEEWHAPGSPSTGEVYSEPPFLKRLELPGVRSAARVLKGSVDVTVGGQWTLGSAGTMMAIDPAEFARTAWFRSDFTKAPFIDYLALLSRHHEGVLVSREYFDEEKLAVGGNLEVSYEGQKFEAYVAAVVDYWPTMDPTRNPFFIMNLEFVQENTRLVPYEVWYRLSDHDHVQEMVSALVTIGVYPTQVKDAEAMIAALKREPYRMGFFGILSFGFIISSLITVLGFLVHTYFSIKGRVVQFGALRAMGLSGLQLSLLMIVEQFFTLGAGLGLGTGLGMACSRLFLPFLRVRAAELQPVPPFLLVSDRTDVLYVMAVLVALFLVAVTGLTIILARMKVNRALTLGEESEA
jgi:putative ABC transport system permease protein